MNYATGRRWPLMDEASGDNGGAGGGGGEDKGGQGGDGLGTLEDQARRMGWVPETEFRGDKAKWTDAATFVKNGMESLPILRERNRTLQKTNEELSRSLSDFKKMSDENFEKGYAKAKRELEAQVKAMAKAGDEDGAAAAANDLAELERQKAERAVASGKDPVFDGWVAQNAWYNDSELNIEAQKEAFGLRLAGDKSEGVEFLDKVKGKLRERYPEKFGNPRRDPKNGGAPERPTGGGEGGGGGGGGKKGWETLPTEAKEAGERYIKQKLFKDKAEYAASYWAQND
jgi:hypothetical protein